ncbi:hypothetical protein D8I30_03460 [Brevundimonas naejangsanensis]|uniref:Uncharacterized protein n=1 Tax=Brevundimonas naejangsanensis TaxID=588932 RepID=A0A494RDF5_9CAUL|nr:hypothetical protein [Brevundimonas naejangsanensis]AYG94347.1 hypothetical protein D8I30_03460 [Brevundimonas naejangsanensis]
MSRKVIIFAALAAAATAGIVGTPVTAQQPFAGRTVAVPAARGETEPGAVYAGNWTAIYTGLQAMVARPADEDEAVIAEVRAMGEAAPPPYLMEMGRRLAKTNLGEGAYWFQLGRLRGTWDGYSCIDRSARGGLQIVDMTINQTDPDAFKGLFAPAVQLAAFERLGDGSPIFAGRASAWWICSHGIQATMNGMNGGGGGQLVPVTRWLMADQQRTALKQEMREMIAQVITADKAEPEAEPASQ